MKLSDLKINDKGVITKVRGRGAFRKRITEMGFVKGKTVTVVKDAPLKDPIEYNIMGYEVSLRKSEAELIEVVTIEEAKKLKPVENNGVTVEEILNKSANEKRKHIYVGLVGNPNCGKTTLFNNLTGATEHVGNYSGVTVDAKEAVFKHGDYTFHITDLPGTYSLSAYTPEELYVRNFIINEVPDVIINVVDASNLERNLFLTTQLIDMDLRVVVALNMFDELEKKGDRFDYVSLGKMIGMPFVPTVGHKGRGLVQLLETVIKVYEDRSPYIRHIHINYGKEIENAIKAIQKKIKIKENYWLTDRMSSRFLAIKLLEKDNEAQEVIKKCSNYKEILKVTTEKIKLLENSLGEDSETLIADAKYGFISGALKETYKEGASTRRRRTEIIDTFLTHKLFGFPIFIFFMWIMFQATFSLGKYPMEWIDWFVTEIGSLISEYMQDGMLKDLIIDGVIGGVGGVIVFLPNIILLFFFISVMEDTGYMARVAFIMDKIMHKIGLHGKSFIPLLMGFGCNVPAIMSTRTLENRTDRILTILINPFMSCSARLPVYLVILGAIFPQHAGSMLFGIYVFGVLTAAVVAIIFKKTIFKKQETPFVMELPPYRIPTAKATVKHIWNKAKQYLQKMGGIILVASVLIWALGYFPKNKDIDKKYDTEIQNIKNSELQNKDSLISVLNTERQAEQQARSYIGRMGHAIEPFIRPLGFDWKMGVSLISGIAAKEVVISTMGVLYQADSGNKNKSSTLMSKIKNETYKNGDKKGQKVFTPVAALAFLVFVLLYFPCVAVIAAIRKETGSWKWAVFTILYTTGLAWIAAFLIYQIGNLIV